MSTNPVHTRIQALLHDHPVVLFMKGTRTAPSCGFSAAASGVLNELLPDYLSVDVLEDAQLRDAIKAFGNWPTIPQLYVKGELIGGADIVQSMYANGQLQELLGVPAPDRTPPQITISDAAARAIAGALAEGDAGLDLHLAIDAQYHAQFHLDQADANEICSHANGIAIYMDLASANRARGVRIDWVETAQGAGLAIDNPNAPATIRTLSVQELKARLQSSDITLIDVRPPEERALAALAQPFRTLDAGIDTLAALPKDTALAFLCHTGIRSAHTAAQFCALGFRRVYNVKGGIDAWAREIDTGLPRY